MSIGTTVTTFSDLERRVLNWTIEKVRTLIREDTSGFELVMIDQNDNLTDEQIAAYIKGDYETLDEITESDWYLDAQADGVRYVLEDKLADVQKYYYEDMFNDLDIGDDEPEAHKILDGLDFLDINGDNDLDQEVWDRDTSDPIKQLAGNTGSQLFRTTVLTGEMLAGMDPDSPQDQERLVEMLQAESNLDYNAALAAIVSLTSWDVLHEGMDLDVIWWGDIEDARTANMTGNAVTFTDCWLLLIDRWNGSGETYRLPQDAWITTTRPTELDEKCAGYSWTTIAGPVQSTYRVGRVNIVKEAE